MWPHCGAGGGAGEEGEGPRGVSERGEVRQSGGTMGEGTAASVSLQCCSQKVPPLRQQLPASLPPMKTLDPCFTCQLLMF